MLVFLLIVAGSVLGRVQTIYRDRGRIDLPSSAIRLLIEPLAIPGSKLVSGMGEFCTEVMHGRSLAAENAKLEAEKIGYRAYAERVDFLDEQIDELRKQIALPASTRTHVNLDVIGISQTDGQLILNGGSERGIRPDQAVINGDGIVGIVETVFRGECRVSMLSAYGLKIFAVDSSRKPPEEGLLRGTGESVLTMRMLNPKDPVASGDIILTSLKSKNIPAGLVVGRVISVEADPYYGTTKLTVDPAVNLGTIHEVQVLK